MADLVPRSSARAELPLFAGGMGSIAEAERAEVILGAYPGRVSLGVGRSEVALPRKVVSRYKC